MSAVDKSVRQPAPGEGLQLAPESMAFDVIRSDHREVRDLLAAAAAAHDVGQRQRMRDALYAAVDHHLRAEEEVVYTQLRKIGALDSFVDRMVLQHQLIRDAMTVLATAELSDTAFISGIGLLRTRIDEHFDEEERRLFVYAAEHLAGELEVLAIEMEDARGRERGAYGPG